MLISNKIKYILLSLLITSNYGIMLSAQTKQKGSLKNTKKEITTQQAQNTTTQTTNTPSGSQSTTVQSAMPVVAPSIPTTAPVIAAKPATPAPIAQQSSTNYAMILAEIQSKQLNDTKKKCTQLLAMINHSQIRSLSKKEKATAQKSLKLLISSIDQYQISKFNGRDPKEIIIELLDMNEAIIQHLTEVINNHTYIVSLTKIADTYTHNRAKNPQVRSKVISHARILEKVKHNKQLLKQLTKTVDYAGLRWYNHIYRAIDKVVVSPIIDYSILQYMAVAGLGSLGCMYAYWKFDFKDFKDSNIVPQYWKDQFGKPPAGSYKIVNGERQWVDSELTTLSKVLETLSNGTSIAAAAFLMKPLQGWIEAEWTKKLKPDLLSKIESTRNRLKGGIHNTIADEMDGVVQNVTFNDLIGIDDVVEKFKLIVDYMADPELHIQLGLIPDKGYLLIGPPRTGKTLSVHALFNELHKKRKSIKIMNITPGELWKKGGIKAVLDAAKAAAPCIIFVDEIDLLKLQRGANDNALNDWLTGMSDLLNNKDPNKQVIIIAATNRPETLDFALKQPGRFGTEIRFKLPSLEVRKTTLKRRLEKLAITLTNADALIETIALQTEGASFEALNSLINQAYMQAINAKEIFGEKHLQNALNSTIRKITDRLNENISEHEQRLLATHFAGQAYARVLLNPINKFALVTILPHMATLTDESIYKLIIEKSEEKTKEQDRYEYGATYTYKEHDSINGATYAELMEECKVLIAGIVAEEIMYGAASYTCNRNAMEKAMELAKTITFEGLQEKTLPKEEYSIRFSKALALIALCKKEIYALLSTHKYTLGIMINTLQKEKTLDQREVKAIAEIAVAA